MNAAATDRKKRCDLAGNRLTKSLGNGTSVAYGYDRDNRLLAITNSNAGGVFAQFNYALNTMGNRTAKTETMGATTKAETYIYDTIDEVTGVVYNKLPQGQTCG